MDGGKGVERLVRKLDIEEIDRNLYRAQNLRTNPSYPLYGGQVAAQSLVAAARTVPEDRTVHSLHGYFLRAGNSQQPIILHVERDRDGKSFSARRVAAVQSGEVIFNLAVSFHVREDSPVWPVEPGEPMGDPSSLPRTAAEHVSYEQLDMFDIRTEQAFLDRADPREREVPHRLWIRSLAPLPDDPLVHLAVATYVSDLGSGLSKIRQQGGPSLDHAVWFHHPMRLDDWVLLDQEPMAVAGGRGLYRGTMIDPSGRVCASLIQEHLVRPATRRPTTS